jgi:hypothetical protein
MSVDLKQLQTDLKSLGVYQGEADGKWGPLSHGAFVNARRMAAGIEKPFAKMSPLLFKYCKAVAWSAKQSPEFISRVQWIVGALGMAPTGVDDMMACIAWESGETFSAGVVNKAGSGATGLIQFMPSTAKGMGTTVETLAKLSDVAQLDYVYKYFLPYKGKLKNLGDLYMSILWPNGVGKDDSYVLWTAEGRPTTFRQNAGLDVNKDGTITRAECMIKVNDKLTKGLHPNNLRVG